MPAKNDVVIFRGHAVRVIRVIEINGIPHFYLPVPGVARSNCTGGCHVGLCWPFKPQPEQIARFVYA